MRLSIALSLFGFPIVVDLRGSRSGTPRPTEHEHLTEVACIDVPADQERPEFGCFNIGTVKELKFLG